MKRKLALIVAPIGIIIIILIILTIIYLTTDVFKTDTELFWKYFAQNQDVLTIFINDKISMQNEFKENNSYTSQGKLLFELQQGENSSKQLDVETNLRYDVNTNRTYADAKLKNGDIDLFKVSYINSEDIYAIKCDEVFPNYVGIKNLNLNELANKYGIDGNIIIPNTINLNNYKGSFELTDEQREYLANTYFPIIINNIAKEQYEKREETIEIDGTMHKTNMYKVLITSEEIKKIFIDCLNNLKSDNESLTIISDKLSYLQLGTDLTNLRLKIEELIEQIQKSEIKEDTNIYVYEENGVTIRTILQISNIITLTYDTNTSLTVDLVNNNSTNIIDNVTEGDNNEIINLNEYENNQKNENVITRIIITKEETNEKEINKIKIIPRIDNEEQYINIESSMSNIQNNAFSNSFSIELSSLKSEKKETVKIIYNTNNTKVTDVEEIMELTDSNTAIANNYESNQFKEFIKNWLDIFINKLKEKLVMLGFEEFDLTI